MSNAFAIFFDGKCIIFLILFNSSIISSSDFFKRKLYPANISSAPSPVITELTPFFFNEFRYMCGTIEFRISMSLKFPKILIVSLMESNICSMLTCINESGNSVCLAMICAYVRSVPKKSFVIIVIACGFCCFSIYASMLLSNPPDNAIHFDLHSIIDSCKILLH